MKGDSSLLLHNQPIFQSLLMLLNTTTITTATTMEDALTTTTTPTGNHLSPKTTVVLTPVYRSRS